MKSAVCFMICEVSRNLFDRHVLHSYSSILYRHLFFLYPAILHLCTGGSALLLTIQAVAVRVSMHKVLTICWPQLMLKLFVRKVPSHAIICGDFNGYNTLWGSQDTNTRGQTEKISVSITISACLTNNLMPYLILASGNYSVLDLN